MDLAFRTYEYCSHLFPGSDERSAKLFAKESTRTEAHLPGGRGGGAGALALVSLHSLGEADHPLRRSRRGKDHPGPVDRGGLQPGTGPPGRETREPLTVLYQTAEDGLGDTIKPRLLESQADLQRIYTIDETDFPLSMLDHRIGEAIRDTHAQLVILDPMQAYLGEKVDMNRANEVRTVMKGLTKVANQTGCAIVLVGHLNKSQTANSSQRGLGSMDFRAAARSVLLVGRLKNDRDVRVMVHDKSSLAEEGPSRGFTLDNGPSTGRRGTRTSQRTSC